MYRKLITIVSLMLIATSLLTACGPKTTPTMAPTEDIATEVMPTEDMATEEMATEDMATEDMAEPVTINWWHITTADEQKAVWQKLADEYMADHPNVTIEITVLENEAFKTKLTTVMQSGEPPDIFQSWGGGTLNEYAAAGLMKDITADLDADGGAWRDTFAPGALAVFSYQGANYGVPWDMGMVGFWYNKSLFAEAGIDAPPTTWAELLDDVQTFKDAGITPIAVGEGDKWPGAFWWEYLATRIGGQAAFMAAQDRSGSFASESFVQAGEELKKLVDMEPFQDGFLGATWGDEATVMGNGEAAMDLMGQWAPGAFRENSASGEGLGEELGWFQFPMVEGGAGDPNDAVGGGNGFGIGVNAPPEAIDFVKYLTRAESQVQCAEVGFCIPVVKGGEAGLTDPLMIQIQQSFAQAKYFQLYYDQALTPALGSVVNDSVQEVFAGTLSPADAAQMIEDSAVQELE
jgi:raffinose/stachyose/melibiose transport system substrate-binding protein